MTEQGRLSIVLAAEDTYVRRAAAKDGYNRRETGR